MPQKKPIKKKSPPSRQSTSKIVPAKKRSKYPALIISAIFLLSIGLIVQFDHSFDRIKYHAAGLMRFFHHPSYKNHSIDYKEYQHLANHLSLSNQKKIENFLNENPNSSLTMGLRNNWLLFLAQKNHWDSFLTSYKPTNNQAVECYYLQALYHSGQKNLALSGTKRLWLAGYKASAACNALFEEWQKSSDFKEEYFWPRIQLAIDENDLSSLSQLEKTLSPQKKAWIKTWLAIRKNPDQLLQSNLPDNDIGQRIVVDGLKKWAAIDIAKAIESWNTLQKKYHFNETTSQDFYLTASIHLALNGDPRAETWFAKILPAYSTTQSRTWQIRFALMHQNWPTVLNRINSMPMAEQKNNMWQYWKARALQATGHLSEATTIYEKLSKQRQYYGFLAAYQQHKPLAIEQQDYPQNMALLSPYTEQIAQIQKLYLTRPFEALQLTQDLLNQLNSVGQYTLANLFAQWEWYAEAMTIINRSPYQNDLKLRFPMPHDGLIMPLSKTANISSALVYAIARQESNFHEDVFSRAGGLGILQLTLSTAQQFDPSLTEKSLYDPATNIRISIAYLKKLSQQFNQHPLLVASAYNAGPNKTRSWQPKSAPMPADIWIEIRPWEETRNYMKNILAYDAVYQYLLGARPNIDSFMKAIPVSPITISSNV